MRKVQQGNVAARKRYNSKKMCNMWRMQREKNATRYPCNIEGCNVIKSNMTNKNSNLEKEQHGKSAAWKKESRKDCSMKQCNT